MVLQYEKAKGWIIAIGKSHSVRNFYNLLFLTWELMIGYIVQDPKFYRLAEVDVLKGDSSKAKKD